MRSIFLVLLVPSAVAMEVKIFNVGQGNCTVVKHPTKQTLLVDAGTAAFTPAMRPDCTCSSETSKKQKKEEIIAYIGSQPVVALVSHGDRDHYGWIPTIINALREKKVEVSLLLGGIPSDYVSENNNPTLETLVDLRATLGGKFASECTDEELQMLTPDYCTVLAALRTQDDNTNKRSIVVRIDPFNMLLPGDADRSTTSAVLRKHPTLSCQLFVAAHHGTDTDSCNDERFLSTVSPATIFVSAGCSKSTKHPTGAFIKRALRLLAGNPRATPHTITYHPKGLTEEIIDCKTFLMYEKGYVSAMSCAPLFCTIDVGDITITRTNGITRISSAIYNEPLLECPDNEEQLYKARLIKSISRAPLTGMTKIDLTDAGLTDQDVLALDGIQSTVRECILDGNSLTGTGIIHIILRFSNQYHPVSLSLARTGFRVADLEKSVRTNLELVHLIYTWLLKSITEVSPNGFIPLLQRKIQSLLMTTTDSVFHKHRQFEFYQPVYAAPESLPVVYFADGYMRAWRKLEGTKNGKLQRALAKITD